MNKKLIKGFTLAETLIVITVLGIVAMLTVPNVIKQHMEAVARTKIKKSMTVYDLAITKMTVENDLRSDTELIKWSKEVDNCGNTVAYFKTANNKSCEFKTSDGVWWDISDIMNPIIALSIDDLHTAQAEGINGKTSFKLVASFDRQSGAFRIDDLGYEKLKLAAQLALAEEEDKQDVEDNVEELELLFGFIDNKKDGGAGGGEEVCEVTRSQYNKGTWTEKNCHGKQTGVYYGCDESGNNCSSSFLYKYDKNGHDIGYYSGCDGSGNNCTSSGGIKEYDDNGNQTSQYENCDGSGNNCTNSQRWEYDYNGHTMTWYGACDGSGNNCSVTNKHEYDDNWNETAWYNTCDGSGNNCSESYKYEYDDSGKMTISYYCDGSGSTCYGLQKYEYDDNGKNTSVYYCNTNGIKCEYCEGTCSMPKNSHGYYDLEDTVYDDEE